MLVNGFRVSEKDYALGTIMKAVQERGRVRYSYWDRKFHAVPFGHTQPNDATFGKSVFDPESSLVKVLRFIEEFGYVTKKDICIYVFGFIEDRKREKFLRFDDKSKVYYPVNLSGWRSPFFSALKKCGFVQQDRIDYGYTLTPLGQAVVDYHRPSGK